MNSHDYEQAKKCLEQVRVSRGVWGNASTFIGVSHDDWANDIDPMLTKLEGIYTAYIKKYETIKVGDVVRITDFSWRMGIKSDGSTGPYVLTGTSKKWKVLRTGKFPTDSSITQNIKYRCSSNDLMVQNIDAHDEIGYVLSAFCVKVC